jgi:hypothetical protein
MYAKALLFVCASEQDVAEARQLLLAAERGLSIAYGESNDTVRDIREMLGDL